MKAGLDTMQGSSDAVRCITEGILTNKIPERQSHKSKVRTTLKQSFRGSYGHVFSVDIYDDRLKKKFDKIGKTTFAELIAYYLNESIYEEYQRLSPKAQAIIDGFGERSENLTGQLRTSALKNLHEVPTKFNYEVKIRFRQSRDNQTILAKFNQDTATVLDAEESNEEVDLTVSITRLNINTGNGRLLVEGENDTVAFGFIGYRGIKLDAKKVFSENLDYNNGLPSEKWRHLKISATPIKLRDGKIIKYIVKGLY
ncbi:hypothetical protein [Cupriavidus taiwanensis]|uniref:hypothetical protein n=1 Tax=Cupriavidus taiwanensis TaxID=164546 RepID=UPI001F03143A|nr:hypothetical protein [Cupriavidus taiwanensis]